jgi:TonB family protein
MCMAVRRRIIPRGSFFLLEIAHLHERANVPISFDSSPDLPAPRLALGGTGTLEGFFSSLTALVRGPAAPKEFPSDAFFRDCWINQNFPKYAFAAAIALQAFLVVFPPPIWNIHSARTVSAAPPTEIAWYRPAKDLPAILPAVRLTKPAVRKDAPKPLPPPGADAFHPRQTILSEPLHLTHPRQTLIQPKAPLEPPKILPALPNIVQLAEVQPERPKLQLSAKELASLRPKTPAMLKALNVAAPEISALEKQPGAIDIASSTQASPKPLLPVNPMSAPRASPRKVDPNVAAPDVGRRAGGTEMLIALSATPAPVAPPPAIPAGNLSARVSISPNGLKSGAPAGNATGSGHGPEGIFITGGKGAKTGPISGLGIGPSPGASGNALPSRPMPRTAPEGPNSLSEDAEGAALAAPKLGMAPEKVLGAKRVYTILVNMPNLTSVSGSWILNFAELNESAPTGYGKPHTQDLAGPVPVKKVDPKYPPEFRSLHVEGEVVLYAIIRKDGSVDSIQLVHSVDPRLDANAMEALAQWKFRPAEKRGEPVDLEAVVHIPFRSRRNL